MKGAEKRVHLMVCMNTHFQFGKVAPNCGKVVNVKLHGQLRDDLSVLKQTGRVCCALADALWQCVTQRSIGSTFRIAWRPMRP